MPCDSGHYPGPNYRDAFQKITALLCEACTHWGDTMPETVRLWWEIHQAEDRREQENLKKERAYNRERLKRDRAQIDAELAMLGED